MNRSTIRTNPTKNLTRSTEFHARKLKSDRLLDPDYNASKKDVLAMQEAILQVQLRTEERYHQLNNKIDEGYHELNSKIDKGHHELNNKIDKGYNELNSKVDGVRADLRVEIAAISRQFWITFGGLICTILSVFLVNWYYHL